MSVSKLAHSSNIRRQRYAQLDRIDESMGFNKKEVKKKEPEKVVTPDICLDCKFKPTMCYVGRVRGTKGDFTDCSNKVKVEE